MNCKLEKKSVFLEVNLDNLAHNFLAIKKLVDNKSKIMAIVKGNAYGHGSIECAKLFLKNGADYLGVSTLSEGIELRKAGIKAKILLFNYTPLENFDKLLNYNLIQSIYNYEDAKAISLMALKMDKIASIHLNIDTGMTRLGFLPNEESFNQIEMISNLSNVIIDGIYSHFVKAEEKDKTYSKLQFDKFIWAVNVLKDMGINTGLRHISGSSAIIDLPEYKLDMVRPGIILYGHYPSEELNTSLLPLKQAMSLTASISNIKTVPSGTGISYNHTFITQKESIIGTLPIGYADGFTRRFGNNGKVFLRDRCVPIIGKICMDQMMIDISDIPDIKIGDKVIIFGYLDVKYPTVEDLANILDTINYEVLCSIGRRIPRVYTKKDKVIHIVDYLTD